MTPLCPPQALAEALPDVIYVSSNALEVVIPHEQLLANDEPVGQADLSIESWPAGLLALDTTELRYTPDGVGGDQQDAFTYRLDDAAGTSVAEVQIIILPMAIPITGRWPVEQPHPGPPCSHGDGAEWGFYYPGSEQFRLCDYTGGVDLATCETWQVPTFGPSSNNRQPLLPIMGDWNQDSWHEPGLYDPVASTLETFAYGGPCSGQLCLISTGLYPLELFAGQHLLGTDWDTSATYVWPTQTLTAKGAEMSMEPSGQAAWPVAGDWFGTGDLLLGQWHPATSRFHYLGDPGGSSVHVFVPVDSDEQPAAGVAFSGRWSECGTESFLGILMPELGIVGLFDLSSSSVRPPVHVKVPVDPPDQG